MSKNANGSSSTTTLNQEIYLIHTGQGPRDRAELSLQLVIIHLHFLRQHLALKLLPGI